MFARSGYRDKMRPSPLLLFAHGKRKKMRARKDLIAAKYGEFGEEVATQAKLVVRRI